MTTVATTSATARPVATSRPRPRAPRRTTGIGEATGRIGATGEGAKAPDGVAPPDEDAAKPGAGIVITTSEHDTANPLAWFLSRARHAGGWRGLVRAREHPAVFEILDGHEPTERLRDAGTCRDVRERKRVVMVDAKSFVFDHNDVLDLEAGELVWAAVRCFTTPPGQRGP